MKKTLLQIADNIPLKVMAIVTLVFFIGMVMGAFGYTKLFQKKTVVIATNTPKPLPSAVVNYPLPLVIEEPRETTKNAITFNILLTGHGGVGHSGGGLMDSIIVAHVNVTDKKAALISIPRDYWFSGHKINSDPSLKDAITGISGLPISNSVSIDFGSFVKMIDYLGGITVDTKKSFTDSFYPVRGKENELCDKSPQEVANLNAKYSGFELEKQFTCRYETLSYNVGLHDMMGDETLKYVSSRHGDGDFGRSMRQFEVLKAILQKANVKSLASAFNFVKTDFSLDSAQKMLSEIGNPLEYSINTLNISDQNILVSSKSSAGAYILIPKEGNDIKGYIKSNL